MKKFMLMFILFLMIIMQTGCAGVGDWEYTELPGDYEFLRSSAKKISLAKADPDYEELADIIIDGYITEFVVHDNWIIVKNEAKDPIQYSIVNSEDDSIQTFDSLDELNEELQAMGIQSEDEWMKTSKLKHSSE